MRNPLLLLLLLPKMLEFFLRANKAAPPTRSVTAAGATPGVRERIETKGSRPQCPTPCSPNLPHPSLNRLVCRLSNLPPPSSPLSSLTTCSACLTAPHHTGGRHSRRPRQRQRRGRRDQCHGRPLCTPPRCPTWLARVAGSGRVLPAWALIDQR